jgi:hypothetical protein
MLWIKRERKRFVIMLFIVKCLAIIYLTLPFVAAAAYQATVTPFPTWTASVTFVPPTPIAPTMDSACPVGTPLGWGIYTPSALWQITCGSCPAVPQNTPFPSPTLSFDDQNATATSIAINGTYTPTITPTTLASCSISTPTVAASPTTAATSTPSVANITVDDAVFTIEGTCTHNTGATGAYLDTLSFCNSDSKMTFTYTGQNISLYARRSSNRGIAAIYLDGVFKQNADLWNSTNQEGYLFYTSTGVTEGSHTVEVRYTGTKNASSSGYGVNVDKAVYGALVTPTPAATYTPFVPDIGIFCEGDANCIQVSDTMIREDNLIYIPEITAGTVHAIVFDISSTSPITLYYYVQYSAYVTNPAGARDITYKFRHGVNSVWQNDLYSETRNVGSGATTLFTYEVYDTVASLADGNGSNMFGTYIQGCANVYDCVVNEHWVIRVSTDDCSFLGSATATPAPYDGGYCGSIAPAISSGFGFDLFVPDGAPNCDLGWDEFGFDEYTVPAVQICLQPSEFGVVTLFGNSYEVGIYGLVAAAAFFYRFWRTI